MDGGRDAGVTTNGRPDASGIRSAVFFVPSVAQFCTPSTSRAKVQRQVSERAHKCKVFFRAKDEAEVHGSAKKMPCQPEKVFSRACTQVHKKFLLHTFSKFIFHATPGTDCTHVHRKKS